jgi:hypothetical protein
MRSAEIESRLSRLKFSWGFSAPQKIQECFDWARTASLQILSSFPFTNHHTLQRIREIITQSLVSSMVSIMIDTFSSQMFLPLSVSSFSDGAFSFKTPWPESTNKLYRLRDRRLSAKLVPTFADRGCHVVSVTDPYGRILGFLDRSHYFFLSRPRSRPTTSRKIW